MVVEVMKPPSGGEVKAITSKSQAHRLLICSAFADGETYIECAETSDDVDATVHCLENLGANIQYDGAGFRVKPVELSDFNETITQYCRESGSTLRFMLPICCALGVSAEFVMDGRLPDRPMSPLLKQLMANGCEIIKVRDPIETQTDIQVTPPRFGSSALTRDVPHEKNKKTGGVLRCSGKLESGLYELPGSVSSQFISGLLFALPLLSGDSVIIVEGREESRPYIAMTLAALSAFNVTIDRVKTRTDWGSLYKIRGPSFYRTPGTVSVEGDWSNAAFWLCAGAIGGAGVTCGGLNLGSSQGDMAITRLLERFGANVAYGGNSVTVSPSKLRGIQIDAIDTPDLVPAISVVASVAEGETLITNVDRLRLKESDRMRSTAETLRTLGADVSETQKGLMIKGKKSLRGGAVSSFSDHRIAMMASIASVVCKNPVIISDAEAVNKSYPGFFKDFEKLDGQIRALYVR